MVFDLAGFRTAFPEFGDTVKYPDALIQFWAGLAQTLVRPSIWGNHWLQGVSFYVAHELTIAGQNAKAGASGGVPGGASGSIASKAVGSVSVSFDATSSAEKDAGWWNGTNYGKQFIRLARIFGSGVIQL